MTPYSLPVPIQTMQITAPNISITYPQIIWLSNHIIQDYINYAILQKIYGMFHFIEQQGYFQLGKTEMLFRYEIKNNQRGIISLTLSSFANMFLMAHPVDSLTSLTTNMRTGKIYQLQDLFKLNSPYIERISEQIKVQLKQRNLPLFKEFTSIRPNQDFYISDKTLTIFFQRYEIGPRPIGYPMFPISIYNFEDIIEENGPLGIMIRE
jgi:hypothetical protein